MHTFLPIHQKLLSNGSDKSLSKSLYFFFRLNVHQLQESFCKKIDPKTPSIFLHGNPHIENYGLTEFGHGLVDFDRARFGPFSWDLVRFLTSVFLKMEGKRLASQQKKKLTEKFLASYLEGFLNPSVVIAPISFLNHVEREQKLNKKWLKRLRQSEPSLSEKFYFGLIEKVLENYQHKGLKKSEIVDIGESIGSLGKKHYIYHFQHKNKDYLVDVKDVYRDEDLKLFHNKHAHHGQRMVDAAKLYAPGVEGELSYGTYKGEQYWSRIIPVVNKKIKDELTFEQALEVVSCCGAQLAQGHAKACTSQKQRESIETSLISRSLEFENLCEQMLQEIHTAFDYFSGYLSRQVQVNS